MDVKDLRYFVAVYEAEGFSRASRELGTVQSNVSARIAALERRLGALLFKRQYRRLAPTDAALKFRAASSDVVAALSSLERTMRRARRRVRR